MVGEARRKGIKNYGEKVHTVLLRDVFDDKGSYVTSHQWLDNEYGFTDEDVGKTIEFEATISPYIKHINTKMVRDFKLSNLTNIIKETIK